MFIYSRLNLGLWMKHFFFSLLVCLFFVPLPVFGISEFELAVQKAENLSISLVSTTAVILNKTTEKITEQEGKLFQQFQDILAAFAIAKLVDQEKISWKQKISSLQDSFILPDSYIQEKTTLGDLLCYRTGLLQTSTNHLLQENPWRVKALLDDWTGSFLGKIIEVQTGQNWIDFVKQQLFEPFGFTELTTLSLATLFAKKREIFLPMVLQEMERPHVSARDWDSNQFLGTEFASFASQGLGWHIFSFQGRKVLSYQRKGCMAVVVEGRALVMAGEGDMTSVAMKFFTSLPKS